MYYVWNFSGSLAGTFETKEEAFSFLDEQKAYRVTFVRGIF